MATQVQEQRKKHRVAEEIVIDLIEALRQSPDGLSQIRLVEEAGLHWYTRDLFFGYMAERGLIEPLSGNEPIKLTYRGRTIPLEPEEFSNFQYPGGKRSGFGIRRDIRRVILGYGKASPNDIAIMASLSGSAVHRHLNQQEADGEIIRISNNSYGLTEYGLSKTQDDRYPPIERIERIKRPISSGTGETLTRILEAACEDGYKSMGGLAPTIKRPSRLNRYIQVLFKYDLLAIRDGEYHTTDFYEELDKEALPYALDILVDAELSKKKRGKFIEWKILQESYKPRSVRYFRRVLKGEGRTYEKHLDILKEKKYVSSTQQGITTFYKTTRKGESLITRIGDCAEQLRLKVAQI